MAMEPEEFINQLPKNVRRSTLLMIEANGSVKMMEAQIKALQETVFSLCQEMEVLREALLEKKVVSETEYKKSREKMMLCDHSSAGAEPWQRHSYYRYVLNEEDFLDQILGLNEDQIKKFRVSVNHMERQT